MNMKIRAGVTPPSIYHGYSTWKTLWEEKFTLGEFTPVNIKIVSVTMLGNTDRLKMVRSTSPWTSR